MTADQNPIEERDVRERGFTLIELLVVMIVIGILAAIAIPTFLAQKNKAKDTSAKSDLVAVVQSVNGVLVDGNPQALSFTVSAGAYFITGTDAASNSISIPVRLSAGNTVNTTRSSYNGTTGTYCVEVDTSGGGTWRYNNASVATAVVGSGTC